MSTAHSKKRTYPRITDISKTLPRVGPSSVEETLGAKPTGLDFNVGGSPATLIQVREELMRRLQSNGGRPSLLGTSSRKKVPLSDSQWHDLEEIASDIASPGFSPSPGQIASVLITLSLRSVRKNNGDAQVKSG